VLDHGDVIDYLVQRGLLQTKRAADGSLVVRDLSRRNRNFALDCGGDAPSYFLKQGIDADGAATVLHEAGVYTLFSAPACAMARYLPRLFEYDAGRGVLILELVPGARDFRAHHLHARRFSTTLARGIGDALGVLHSYATAQVRLIHPGATPWMLSIHRPDLDVFREASAASLELIKIIQSTPRFGWHLDQLRSTWQSKSLIHQDLKWENFLAYRPMGSKSTAIKIVDWEALCLGDPCWDIGSVFGHYLSFWLQSIPATSGYLPERFPELARHPLRRMQPAMRACWQAYTRRRGLDDGSSAALLLRTASFAAVGLVASAYGAAQMSTDLDSNLILHLQLAMNMLARPGDAAVHLLGVGVAGD
jgi:aminoglycoside phosphotransferase (APT) family kinase protein